MPPPSLTVLICTHNRADLLQQLLDSLDAAARPDTGVNLLVVANACSDGTHALLERRASSVPDHRLPLHWVPETVAGKSHALNCGLREIGDQVGSALVAFIDDDQRVDAGYLRALCEAARAHPEADMFCGRLIPDWTGNEPAWVHDQGRYRIYPLPTPNFDPGDEPRLLTEGVALPGGGNIVARRPWLERIGQFATDLGPVGHDLGGAEDADWLHRALGLGARLLYVPGMRQFHYVDPDRLKVSYLMRKAYKRSAAAIGLHGITTGGAPAYAYRKLAEYALSALTALSAARRRFYLIRCAAALGEIAGHGRLRLRRSPGSAIRPTDHA